jgi:hypothetical protein
MTRIVVDSDLRTKLLDFCQALELCDAAGRVVGRLYPAAAPSAYEPWEPPMDEPELQRREKSKDKRHSTAEVLEHLGKLGNC